MGNITFKKKPNSEKEVKKILNPNVNKWFFNKFSQFSEPQKHAVLDIHSRKNILVSAPTGATKTLTAFLSILNELFDSAVKGILEDKIYCVYVSPLKALNNDIKRNLIEPLEEMEELYGEKLGIRVDVRTGDTTTKERSSQLKKPPHILITTPESLGIVLNSPKFRMNLTAVDWFIADEIHALSENKRGVHLSLSMERLAYLSPHMARIGLSATIAPLEEVAKYLAGNRDCNVVDVDFTKKMDLKVISAVPDFINTSIESMHTELYKKVHELIQEHQTTLIFTNTRSATERVVDHLKEMYPNYYGENIGAHHGSLSAEHRTNLEKRLKEGELKAVVCSTSLELGIDIGHIDLVITLGSPKSVARALQRIGRSGHKIDSITKGRIIVMDRDDLVECSVLLKSAVEKKIDRLTIPKNSLDVLAQHIYGMAIADVWGEDEMFELVRQSYCYNTLARRDFDELLSYLAGEFAKLEDRNVYAKIWRNEGKIGRRGKMARVIYMTNIGTIPDQTSVVVKVGNQPVGTIDEQFLERLRPGDVFVLGGSRYQFRYSRGMVAQATPSVDRPPTVPSWVSEMLPLSYDLAKEIGKFRRLVEDRLNAGRKKEEIIEFIHDYLFVDSNSAEAIYNYLCEQFYYLGHIPNDKKVVIEHYHEESGKKIIFHTLHGRRVNDVLSRAFGYAVTRGLHKDVELALNDNGFYLGVASKINVTKAMKLVRAEELRRIMENALENSEILKRRFRHCAARALMILRNYMGRKKNAGKQQVNSMMLLNAVKRISDDFPILKEARREVLDDQMDFSGAKEVLEQMEDGSIEVVEANTQIPSPFAFNIVLQGVMDVVKLEDKMEFLQRMHNMVLAKISLAGKKGKGGGRKEKEEEFDYYKKWEEEEKKRRELLEAEKEDLKIQAFDLDEPSYIKQAVMDIIDGFENIDKKALEELEKRREEFQKKWPRKLSRVVLNKLDGVKNGPE